METPVPANALCIAPPPLADRVVSLVAMGGIPGGILLGAGLLWRSTDLWWIAPLAGLVLAGIGGIALARWRREPVYGLDAHGIFLLEGREVATHLLAWSDIAEVRAGKQDDLLLYTQGRERVVKIKSDYQNYRHAAPLLAEYLAPLWREMSKKAYDESFKAYLIFLITIILILMGLVILSQAALPSLIFIGIGLLLAYQQSKSVRRIHFSSDGMVLTKVYGRELISVAAIRTVELQPTGGGYAHNVLLKLNHNRTIALNGFGLDPISLYCIVAVWQRDQLVGSPL